VYSNSAPTVRSFFSTSSPAVVMENTHLAR
jgi:hypothetical protein